MPSGGFSGIWVFGGLTSISACLGVDLVSFGVWWEFVAFIWFIVDLILWVGL